MLTAEDPRAVLAAESDAAVAHAAESLYGCHQQVQAENFLGEPITLVRNLDPEAASTDRQGETFGHFRILRKLGEGGMGKVYLAEDLTLHRQVALKFLALKHEAGARGFLERFHREARAAAALKHPNICTIYGVEECDGQPLIEMEYLEGETLAARIVRGALPAEEALTLAAQIAGALAEAHRKGIVHRDLKPANIMLTPFGVKVLDFGLAKIIVNEESGELTSTLAGTAAGTVLGTPYYMSPEQARAEEADGRSDIFSLGVVLYEMATGERPFTGNSSQAIVAAVLKDSPVPVSHKRPELPARLDELVAKALEKDRDLRYRTADEMSAACCGLQRELEAGRLAPPAVVQPPVPVKKLRRIALGAVTTLSAVGALVIWLTAPHKARALSATDVVVLADFANRTGDPALDGDTLKEALSAELIQSPFLRILPVPNVMATLKLMSRPIDSKLDNDTAREVCQRAGGRAYIGGAISRFGAQYRIFLQAVECQSAETFARTEATADTKEKVIPALGEAGKALREKVGESLASVQQFSVPLKQVTTPSLDALTAYTKARALGFNGDVGEAQGLLEYAIRLDSKFAMAILALGMDQLQLGESASGAENIRKAYDLRENLSEWEKFAIESRYYFSALGDLEQARRTYAAWAKTYPRDDIPVGVEAAVEEIMGNLEAALEHRREALRINPTHSNYNALSMDYYDLDRLDEAKSVLDEGVAKYGSAPDTHGYLYVLDFLRNDRAGMAQQVAWSVGKPDYESSFQGWEAGVAWYSGRVGAARKFMRNAIVMALRSGQKEAAAALQAQGALEESLFGNREEARQQAAAALKLSRSKDIDYVSALALVMAGDSQAAKPLEGNLARNYPSDTLVQFHKLPVIRGSIALQGKDYAKAIDILQPALPYELGDTNGSSVFASPLYAAYVRGEAYLGLNRYPEAASEFQKIVNHRGLVDWDPIGSLARLNLARAYAGQHDAAKAKESYENFLSLWKDADPGIPVLKEAQSEYRKLR
jgi:serine/threonine protein kinase/tetratricopeptide (TPR) repeat protein